jgi:hypothetical protein
MTVVVTVSYKHFFLLLNKKGETGFVCRPNILFGIPSNVFLSFLFVITLSLTLSDYHWGCHTTVMMKHPEKHQNTPGDHLKELFVPSTPPNIIRKHIF